MFAAGESVRCSTVGQCTDCRVTTRAVTEVTSVFYAYFVNRHWLIYIYIYIYICPFVFN